MVYIENVTTIKSPQFNSKSVSVTSLCMPAGPVAVLWRVYCSVFYLLMVTVCGEQLVVRSSTVFLVWVSLIQVLEPASGVYN